jgi:hypothetical protein
MWLEDESATVLGLRRYARLVERALRLGGGGYYVQTEPTASIYLPLPNRLSSFPDHDVALYWDERRGWAIGIEVDHDDLTLLTVLPGDPLPKPRDVAAFVDTFYAGHVPDNPPPRSVQTDRGELARRLARYATSPVAESRS